MYGLESYGDSFFGDDVESINSTTPLSTDLIKLMPHYYKNNKLINEMLKAYSIELINLINYAEYLQKQFSIETAEEGLTWLEKDLGIETDLQKPEYFRREKIRAKLQSRGTVTKSAIKTIAKTFTNSEVEIIEDNSNFKFTIKFVGVKGIPPNMADLIETIELIKPAHLTYEFEYSYTWWNKVSELNWNEANLRTWQQLRTY